VSAPDVVAEGFWAIHRGLPREGPGSAGTTRRALSLLPDVRGPVTVVDLGCGPGAQTMALAEALPEARIVAVDLHEPFVEEVRRRASEAGVAHRVEALVGDMADVAALARFAPADLVWSEGAAYAIGFERALTAWRPLLRDQGALALTEPVWTAMAASRPVLDFWRAAYPDLQPPGVRRAQLLAAGYRRVGDFVLPRSDWEAYYAPIRERVAALRDDPGAAGTPGLDAALAAHDDELAVFDGGGAEAVGYLFLVARRDDRIGG
jgi:predicted O-methyltransferase YrrM